jgi:hypothetical protein
LFKKDYYGDPAKWMRLKNIELISFFCICPWAWSAVAFKPLRDINFFGFGVFGNYHGRNIKIKVQWTVDDF